MRIGFNPNKDKENIASDFFHQVIIPVYIPNQEGYFQNSLEIFQYCLESLFKTCHSRTYFTIVNNGSCLEVIEYINKLYSDGKIHEIIHTTAIGKLNAILKGISGQNFNIVTISDADVLFLNNWQKETYTVFESFPKAGAVCPTPSSKVLKQYTFNVLFEYFFSKKLKFTPTRNRQALIDFAKSIGNHEFYNETQLSYNLTVSNGKSKAVVGAGHFVTSYRGDLFNSLKKRYSNFSLGGDSERELLDEPIANQGHWRLSTEDNFAYHMGNVAEPWMLEKLHSINDESSRVVEMPILKEIHNSKILTYIKSKFFMKIISKKPFWNWFLQYKGLSNMASKNY